VIFRPEMARLISQGAKSQTRRIADKDMCRYEAGKSYAVQPGRGKTAVCRLTVVAVRRERLGDISLPDARREGFRTTGEFFDYWRELHGRVELERDVWVISFVKGERVDVPRLLAARPGGPSGDYTSNPHLAMLDEPEAISEAELGRFSREAAKRDHLIRQARRAEIPLDERIRELMDRARDGSSEAQRALFSIEQRVERVASGRSREAS
jgi:hypothetical protein